MSKQGLKDVAIGRSDVYAVDPRDLNIKPGWNARDLDTPEAREALSELADSIAQVGVKQPLTVVWEGGKIYVTDGHRRYYAAMLAIERGAELKTVRVQLEDRHSSEADQVFSQIVRNSGTPLKPFEQARVFKRLLDLGWTEKDIAMKSGKSGQYVRDLLELQAAPMAVTDLVRSGDVAATLAVKTLKKNKGDAGKTAADLGEAVETAKAAGKTRATAKHMNTEKAPSLKVQLKAVVERSEMREAKDSSGRYVLIMTPDDYATVRSLLGL